MEDQIKEPGIEKLNYEGMLVIHAHPFELDQKNRLLIDPYNSQNTQKIDGLFQSKEFIYGFFEGNSGKFYAKEHLGQTISGVVKPFKIPRRILEAGPKLSESEIDVSNHISIIKGHSYIYVGNSLAGRLDGKLPSLKIEGINYTIDIENLEIRQEQNPGIKFKFDHEAIYRASEMYYNSDTNLPETIDKRITVFPENIVCIKFPPLKKMDIVGYSKSVGEPITNRICYYPWLPNINDISVTSLLNSKIPELVRRNQIELEVQGGHKISTRVNNFPIESLASPPGRSKKISI